METKNYLVVDSVEKLEEAIARTKEAQMYLQLTLKNRLTKSSWLLLLLLTRQEFPLQKWQLKRPVWVL